MRPVIAGCWRKTRMPPPITARTSCSRCSWGSDRETDAPATPRLLEAGDIVLLATDGIDTLSEEETAQVIAGRRTDGPQAVVEALLTAVEAKGHPRQDNTTVVVVEVERSSVHGGSSEHPAEAVVAELATEPPSDETDGRAADPWEGPRIRDGRRRASTTSRGCAVCGAQASASGLVPSLVPARTPRPDGQAGSE